MQTDANGNAIVYDVYERNRLAKGPWSKNHGEYTTEAAAQAKCDELARVFPDREWKTRKRKGLKRAAYVG